MTTKPLLDVLGGNVPETPPVWLMRQAGRYLPEYRAVREKAGDFLSLCFSPDFATEVTLQPIRRYGFDAAILFSDILVIPHGLGQKVAFRQGEGPVLEALGGAPDLDRLNVTGVSERLAPVYEAVGRIRRALPAGVALIGFAGAPWTVASYMVEGGTSRNFTRVRDWSIRAPDSFGKLIGIISEATLEHLSAQVEAGAEVIQIFDSWSGILDDEGFGRWVSGATRDLVAALRRRHPDVPVIGFPRGAGLRYGAYLRETGVTGVSLDPGVPLDYARDNLAPLAVLQGNLDPRRLAAGGEALAGAVGRIKTAFNGLPYIFNLGHGIEPDTEPEHVAELVRLVREGSR